jgi:hypothetical protein
VLSCHQEGYNHSPALSRNQITQQCQPNRKELKGGAKFAKNVTILSLRSFASSSRALRFQLKCGQDKEFAKKQSFMSLQNREGPS